MNTIQISSKMPELLTPVSQKLINHGIIMGCATGYIDLHEDSKEEGDGMVCHNAAIFRRMNLFDTFDLV